VAEMTVNDARRLFIIYGNHLFDCGGGDGSRQCQCGYSQAYEEIRTAVPREHPPGPYPRADEINALPPRWRGFIADLETRCDPAGDLRALRLAQDENRMLRAQVERFATRLRQVDSEAFGVWARARAAREQQGTTP
jgi:hypothetical protein